MASSYGIAITLPLPVAGQVSWDGPLNDLLRAVLDVLAQRVTVDGLSITAALDMQGNALIDATNIEFVTGGDPGIANSVYYSTSGELFCRDGANRAIQLTSGGVVNVAGTGGFGGDYVSSNQNGAFYTNSTQTFTFTAAAGTTFAAVEHGTMKLHNGSATGSISVVTPANLATTYNFTLPVAPPASSGILRMDSTGSLAMLGTTTITESYSAAGAVISNGDGTTADWSILNGWIFDSPGNIDFTLPFQSGDSIVSVSVLQRSGGGTGPLTASLLFRSDTGNTQFVVRKAFNGGPGGALTLQNGATTMTGTLPYFPPSTGSLSINVGTTGVTSFTGYRVVRTRPAVSS